MTSTNCLNCKNELTGNFCSNCGQKADTHRITLKNFIFHDVLHGTFHIDKGILFTAKQALIRPGKAALDYISGKRKPYYNVFYLILITFGLIVFFIHFYDVLSGEVTPEKKYINDASRKMDEIFSQKSKIIIFLFVPFAALNSFMLFKRKKLNLAEHAIIAGMILLGMLLYSLFGNLFFYLEILTPFNKTFKPLFSKFSNDFVSLSMPYPMITSGCKSISTSMFSAWLAPNSFIFFSSIKARTFSEEI